MQSKLKLNSFKIIYLSKVGIINDKKANTIAKEFESDFPVRLMQQQPISAMVLSNNNNNNTMIIEPERITYQVLGDIKPDFDAIRDKVTKLCNVLLIDDTCAAAIDITGLIDSQVGNSFDESLEKFNKFGLQFDSLKGIGLRLLYEEEHNIWEYKIEPFIADKTKYFIQLIGTISTMVHINNITEIASKTFDNYLHKSEDLTKSLNLK